MHDGEERGILGFGWGNLRERNLSGLGINGRIILKRNVKE